MTDSRGFVLHPGAAQDITEIWEYIAADSPQGARQVREEILDAIHALVAFPHQGHVRIDLTARPLRVQTVREYLIVCTPDENPLVVIAVLHGRRHPRVIAAILR